MTTGTWSTPWRAAARPCTPLVETARIAEFAAIYVAGPVAMALLLPPSALYVGMLGLTLIAAGLLTLTPGFAWRELARGVRSVRARIVLAVAVATAAVSTSMVFWLVPQVWLLLPLMVPDLWLMVLLLYPFMSALPQELVYRLLFFRRYAWLFPDMRVAMAVNAGAFALAHLLFWNWPALVLTFAGGWIFAWAFLRGGGFWSAVVLHAVAGSIVFTTGLGVFFYHGAVPLR
jgi:uncharacterized protein